MGTNPRLWGTLACAVITVSVAACSKTDDPPKSTSAPAGGAAARGDKGAAPGGGDDDLGDDLGGDFDDDVADPVEPAAGGGSAIAAVCKRNDDCECAHPDCETILASAALPDSVFECFTKQSCESLCAPDSGAPGSDLYAACMQGVAPRPSGGGGGGTTTCLTDKDCPGNHDCCDGRCYAMGTSLWQTMCMMPSGKF